jgi:uncharacterized protein YqjF (DUF2071 family)
MDRSSAGADPPFLTAQWRELAILNFEIDPVVLRPFVPEGTEIDAFGGRLLMSVVGFLFLDTRVLGWAIPFHRNFEEVNLRFYGRRRVGSEERRGVVFVKELVPRTAVAWTARRFFGERYEAVPMRHGISDDGARRVRYEWGRGLTAGRIELSASAAPETPMTGCEAQFICEHYWGYARRSRRPTLEYRVEHPPWRVRIAGEARLECDAARLYGPEFAPFLEREPVSAFLAEGSGVTVHRGRPLDA